MDEKNQNLVIPRTVRKIFTPVAIVLFFVMMIMILMIYHTMRTHKNGITVDVIKEVPEFILINQFGSEMGLNDLLGDYWIVNFIFTNCGGTCPTMTFQMRELQNMIPADFPVRFVSISVDPERDTPEVLKKYAADWGADQDRWNFLTGDTEEIYSLAREGFLLGVQPDGGTFIEPIMHSQRFVLVDDEGMIRGYFDGFDEEEMARLKMNLYYLLGEEV